jgi:hypothetical protein
MPRSTSSQRSMRVSCSHCISASRDARENASYASLRLRGGGGRGQGVRPSAIRPWASASLLLCSHVNRRFPQES